ncbi:MAG: HIG1 domain-containing protein [Rickettsiaceae bacterium]|nr:HIG1 domain-containing protein [Rickettsiaceae bacterium]
MIYIIIASTLTLLVLCLGVLSMALGNKISHKYGTKLMSLRVFFQALAIFVLLIIYAVY